MPIPDKVSEGTLSSSPDFSAISKKNLKNNKLECVSSREPGLIVGLENVDIKSEDSNKEDLDNFGQYNLTGGTLNVNYSEIIGLDNGGDGDFIQTNGTHTINGNLYLGKEMAALEIFNLSANPQIRTSVGLLDVHGFASVGYLGDRHVSPERRDGQDQRYRPRSQPEGEIALYNFIQGPIIKLQPTPIYWFYGRAWRNRRLLPG